MKVLFLTNIPSPYRVDFFNELGKFCELTVLFEREGYVTRDESWMNYKFDTFRGVILKGISLGKYEKISFAFLPYLIRKQFDFIIFGSVASVTGMLAVFCMRLFHIPYCIEGDGGLAGHGKGLKEVLKRMAISKAKLYFSTSVMLDKYYLKYGAREENIYRYPFTSVREKDILERPLDKEEKRIIRQRLGITEAHVVISVGSFIPRKGMDILIKAAAELDRDLGIYLVGGVPTEQYLGLKEEYHMPHLHFVDFMEKEKLAEYYQAADFFVLATREDIWGLVINEALSYALPVITTHQCIAGEEMIRDHYNGLLVESENIEALRDGMAEFIHSGQLTEDCAKGALETSRC